MIKEISEPFLLFGLLVSSSSCQAKDTQRPSIMPELAKMETTVIQCIDDAASHPDFFVSFYTKSDSGSWDKVKACTAKSGISFETKATEPKALKDFRPAIITAWLTLGGSGPERQLKPKSFSKAISYASCVETAAYASDGFSSKTKKGVVNAQGSALIACKDHPLSRFNAKNLSAANQAETIFADLLANIATEYALEANGWYPIEMRPCILRADGTQSVGCKANPPPRMAPPRPSANR